MTSDVNCFWRLHNQLIHNHDFVRAQYSHATYNYFIARHKKILESATHLSRIVLNDKGVPIWAFFGVATPEKDESRLNLTYFEAPITSFQANNLTRGEEKYVRKELANIFNDQRYLFAYQEQDFETLGITSDYLLKLGCTESLSYNGIINLTLDQDILWSKTRKSYKPLINWGLNNLDLAVHYGMTVSAEVIANFFNLHCEASGRQTRPYASWESQLNAILSEEAFCITAHLDGNLVSAAFFTLGKDICYYSVSASQRKLFSKPLMHALIWKSILYAKQLGYRYYELGQIQYNNNASADQKPSPKEESIALFKSGFGGKTRPFLHLSHA